MTEGKIYLTREETKEKALRILEFRSHSAFELKEKLRRAGSTEEDIEYMIDFCIEYNFAECPHMLCWQFLYPVLYQEEMADLSDYHRNPYDLNFLMDKLTAMIKSSQWAYEKEWRMIMPFDIGNIPAVPMPMPQPKAVYAGCRTAEENLEKLMHITQAKGIPLYQMVKDAHSYNFQCQPLSL